MYRAFHPSARGEDGLDVDAEDEEDEAERCCACLLLRLRRLLRLRSPSLLSSPGLLSSPSPSSSAAPSRRCQSTSGISSYRFCRPRHLRMHSGRHIRSSCVRAKRTAQTEEQLASVDKGRKERTWRVKSKWSSSTKLIPGDEADREVDDDEKAEEVVEGAERPPSQDEKKDAITIGE
jgi:hypothetical protein